MLTDIVQRALHHLHQIAISKNQDQQTEQCAADNHNPRGGHQAVHKGTGLFDPRLRHLRELNADSPEFFAQLRCDIMGLLTVTRLIPLLRQLHLNFNAFIIECLPAGNHLF